MLSLQGVKAETISALPTDERLLALEVLGRHRNRLRKGHHAGNQFRLVIRDVRERSEDDLQELFDELVRRGVIVSFGAEGVLVRNGKGDRGRTFNWVPSCSRTRPVGTRCLATNASGS